MLLMEMLMVSDLLIIALTVVRKSVLLCEIFSLTKTHF